ncbi:DNA cytosine methyltransferase [Salipiger sp.]|uniref:DNA cytosine methyltransferase n=1 Tax=Salipiger sp. TaxID=2078585 RepID=UPI003A971343
MRTAAPVGAPVGYTFCSGIGAPEIAAPWVDWRLASEIDPFPRAVLQERFAYKVPELHNQGEPLLWGDMTEVGPELLARRGVPLPDLIFAGTPCQAFSLAGARQGAADPRGNLTLKFVGICHDIVAARPDGKLAVVWENVPGVLSDENNAFGCFLAGLVGADDPLLAPGGGSWPGVGMVSGPRARAAWRVFNAQYFGVAQRRRRVFLVVDFGGACDPAAVLFEREGLRGDPAQGGKSGQDVAGTLSARIGGGGGLGTDFELDGGLVAVATGQAGAEIAVGRAPTLTCNHEAPFIAYGGARPLPFNEGQITSPTNRAAPKAGDPCHTLSAQDRPPAIAYRVTGNDGAFEQGQTVGALTTGTDKSAHVVVSATGARSHALTAEGFDASEDGTGRGVPTVAVGAEASWEVRRLTPVECHRLQGFPDDHCRIPWRGKAAEDCPDGPQYKALGNSMATANVAWILRRLAASAGWVAA